MSREITLAIETGIGGGSLSILEKGLEIDSWEGSEKIARSEQVLSSISELLSKNSLNKTDIKKIAVSRGPGSFTGVRTGISTAKGLQKGLKCVCTGISVLEAMVLKTNRAGMVITSFAAGKKDICWQIFETDGADLIKNKNSPQISSIEDFLFNIRELPDAVLIVYKDFLKTSEESEIDLGDLKYLKIDENAARYIGLRSEQILPALEILPIYARDANAK